MTDGMDTTAKATNNRIRMAVVAVYHIFCLGIIAVGLDWFMHRPISVSSVLGAFSIIGAVILLSPWTARSRTDHD